MWTCAKAQLLSAWSACSMVDEMEHASIQKPLMGRRHVFGVGFKSSIQGKRCLNRASRKLMLNAESTKRGGLDRD